MKLIERVYEIKGLHCANCAMKIERELNQLNYVDNAIVNTLTSKAILELKEEVDGLRIFNDVSEISTRIEHGVRVKEIIKEDKSLQIEKSPIRINKGKITKPINGSIKVNVPIKSIHQSETASDMVERKDFVISKTKSRHSHSHSHDEISENSVQSQVIKLIIGAVISVAAIFMDGYISLGLYLLAYLIIGNDILITAGRNIIRGDIFDENFLMSIATIGAFAIGEYPEAIGVMLFYQIGEFFQQLAVKKSKKSIADLMDIRPDYANVRNNNGEVSKVSPEDVRINDIIVIRPGEKIPLDGVVVEGRSQLDTSALTGESVPRMINVGEEVLAGTINKTSLLHIKVLREFGQSTVSKILELVESASNKKAPTEKFISKFARYYTPIVVGLAVALAIIPPIFLGEDFSVWLYRALSFLVVSCPCALVVSIPLSFFGGIGGASRSGVLIKGGNYLESLSKAEIVVFDKTGTLTEGNFKVTEIIPSNNFKDNELLRYVSHAEVFSNHPIAKSILEYNYESNMNFTIDKTKVKNFEEIAGKGIKIFYDGNHIYAGNDKLMDEMKIVYDKCDSVGTIVYVGKNEEFVGSIVISDKIKQTSKDAVSKLKSIGIKKTVMLTGDNKEIGTYVAKNLSLDHVRSELMPHEKVEEIEKLHKELSSTGKLIFVGDGINDAPVLARADIGIAMGGVGSDAAIEASDVVIMTDDPRKIATAIKIARKTHKIVMENIIFSLGVKILVLILAALGLANMWMAVFADVGVTLIAVLNAIRAIKIQD